MAKREIIALLETEMPRLLVVWEGTENSGEILEDVCNTLGHAIGLESPELRKLWRRIEDNQKNICGAS